MIGTCRCTLRASLDAGTVKRLVPIDVEGGFPVHHPVPKASDVVEMAHHHVPLTPTLAPLAAEVPEALLCRHTGRACPALASLFAGLAPAGPDARAWVQALAPCGQCLVSFQAERDSLRRLRLGQREREIFLAASEASGALVLTEPGMSRSLSASRRRAGISLAKSGLVSSVTATPAGGRAPRSAVTLTPLGRYVMEAYGRYLRAGKPVRWTRPAKGVNLPGCAPELLRDEALAATHTALHATLGDLKRVLIAAIARPSKDAGALDRLTRHLEEKATLLKAVLEPLKQRPERTLASGTS